MILDNNNSLNYVLNSLQADRATFDAYINDLDQSRFFRITTRRKRDGVRTIYEPQGDALQNIYKNLYDKLVDYQSLLPDYVHGFVKGRSPYTNAEAHLAKKYILNLDISNFFEHIKIDAVERMFIRLGAQTGVAHALAKLCTVNGILPQGTHTSPDIANHCFNDIDQLLNAYASSHGLTYTRYADDMTFSGDSKIRASEIVEIIESTGEYVVAPQKMKMQKRGANQYVTGLTIFDDQQPRISKLYKRRLRLELYYLSKYGTDSLAIRSPHLREEPATDSFEHRVWSAQKEELIETRLRHLRGRINYVNSIEPQLAEKMWSILDKVDV